MALIAHKGAVDLLLKVLETRSARMTGSIMMASYGEASRNLMVSGLLLTVGRAETVASMDDFEDEPTRVEWSPEQGSIGYYASNGRWVAVPVEELAIYGVAMPTFLTQLLVRCERVSEGVKEPLVPDAVWDLGTVKLHGRGKPVSVWFARRLSDRQHYDALKAMVTQRPPPDLRVIITPTADCPELDALGHVVMTMRDVLEAPDGIAIDPAIVAKRLQLVPMSVMKPLRHSANYGLIYVTENPFEFAGDLHRRILKILVDAYNRNEPVCRTSVVLEDAGAKGENKYLYRVFNKNEDWRKFIREKKGNCWIEF
jgi:hypothetical protein